MIYIVMKGHDYDDDFYEIIRKFFPGEGIRFVDSVEEADREGITFSSIYQDPVVETVILFPGGREVFRDEITLTEEQKKDENALRYEIIKSLIMGLNSLEI